MSNEQLTDRSPMPYGKYGPKSKDPRTMEEVPASYLFWLIDNDRATLQVQAYVRENYDVLLKEIKRE